MWYVVQITVPVCCQQDLDDIIQLLDLTPPPVRKLRLLLLPSADEAFAPRTPDTLKELFARDAPPVMFHTPYSFKRWHN